METNTRLRILLSLFKVGFIQHFAILFGVYYFPKVLYSPSGLKFERCDKQKFSFKSKARYWLHIPDDVFENKSLETIEFKYFKYQHTDIFDCETIKILSLFKF